ncbi:hypothetical protein PAPHI01_1370 [Pancytospora philotis]|nr:hypothetical protein PAPHI01_1370 [Pancytospora philotis]
MIAAAVNFLHLCCVLGASDRSASISAGYMAATSDMQEVRANPWPASTLRHSELESVLGWPSSRALLAELLGKFEIVQSAYDSWLADTKQTISGYLCESIVAVPKEAAPGEAVPKNSEDIKYNISLAFKEKCSGLFVGARATELLQVFVTNCLALLDAFSSDCHEILSRSGLSDQSMDYDFNAPLKYDGLDGSCFEDAWYIKFKESAFNKFDTLRQKTNAFLRQTERSIYDRQISDAMINNAVVRRFDVWYSILLEYIYAFASVHTSLNELHYWSMHADRKFVKAVGELLSLHTGSIKTSRRDPQYIEDDVNGILSGCFIDRRLKLVEAREKVASLIQKWNHDNAKAIVG